jgi:hypothetical protein
MIHLSARDKFNDFKYLVKKGVTGVSIYRQLNMKFILFKSFAPIVMTR